MKITQIKSLWPENKDFKLVTPFNLEKPEYITLMPPENLGDGFFIAVMERS